jgi:shikimate kinase
MPRTFILNGMCYSGKSTLGKMLADNLGVEFLDSRDLFFKTYGESEISYLKRNGRELFKHAERKSLCIDFSGVFSCGGSAIYYPEEMENIHNKYEIIWLDADFDIIVKRKNNEGWQRPIVFPEGINSFEELYEQRKKLYEKYYTHRIKITAGEEPSETLTKILNSLVFNPR